MSETHVPSINGLEKYSFRFVLSLPDFFLAITTAVTVRTTEVVMMMKMLAKAIPIGTPILFSSTGLCEASR